MAAFSAKDWKDYPDTSTPITAAALEDLETRVVEASFNAITATGKKAAWGTVDVTTDATSGNNWYGGTASVTHGLGATPVLVFIQFRSGGTYGDPAVSSTVVKNIGSTTFDVQAAISNPLGGNSVLNNGTAKYYWLAIA